ncbi:hypothetical protein CXB51_019297 [Gossypium anomalum]|uniref:Retrovirus-related Pol polyprotein from transposon TNT 1-94 n=1 Tax=Gossypium anomalum TaxID=47600 RepID=A0A8J5ZD99_9ROSI|nr:hypothetical protein CXB51_019297 [Gossypium anomalum]
MKEKTAAALWKRLEQICMPKTLTSKLHMEQRLYAHRLEEGASIHEHLTVFKEILSNLEAMEVQYDKEDLGLILLCSLPPSYSTFRNTILYNRESLTVDEVYDSLTSYDKMKHLVVKPDSQGKSIIARGRQDQNTDNDRGRTQERNPRSKFKGRSKSSNRENFGEADVVEDYSDGELLVTSVKRNNASCKIASVGTIKVKMFDGVVRTLSDVRHVLELKRNLISLSILDSKGYRYTAESGVLKISKGSLVVMKGQRKNTKLYVLQGSTVTGDTAGSSRVPSRGGANYMLTFIDDFSRKVWAFFLKQKSDIVQVRRDSETLDSSSYSTAKRHCRTNEQNDHGEGSMYVVKCQLTEVILGKSSLYCMFLINRSPSISIEKKTPQEVWSGNPTNYSDLKIFVCPAYAHVDNGKLESRSIKCVFLGYKAGVKGYKLWCPENKKVVISRDVSRLLKPVQKLRIELLLRRNTLSPKIELEAPKKYAEADLVTYALNVAEDIDVNQEPSNYSEAISCKDSEKWMFAMQKEMESLHKK